MDERYEAEAGGGGGGGGAASGDEGRRRRGAGCGKGPVPEPGPGPGPAGVSRLTEELRALGRSMNRPGDPGGDSMVERVLEQILAERVPTPVAEPPTPAERLRATRRWVRARGRVLTAGLCGLLTVFVLTPPVRAAVVDWFDFGGVEVRHDPSVKPSPRAGVPGCGGPSLTLAEAERRAGFASRTPPALGPPDAVTVTREPKERFLMSLCWRERGHTIRLDEYPASLSPGFAKVVPKPPEYVLLDEDAETAEGSALWFPEPHLLRLWLVDSDGDFTRSVRTAGPTLLWTHGGDTTLRLEGVASKTRAVEIARSLERAPGRGPERAPGQE
ncbi:hypothetical protein GCM10010372_13030 [Streptomyces tauricus]|uniref:hypothetical protein n=1 Tax=Streptomyces tauricus TaxID=68274 RepID=UPI0019ADFA71|nr:hypothetical protein [Streptomyces tauricus]GHA14760.1 hypothetical protein GCM10010372_13030 [Streptomyces tauricus]